MVNNLCFWDKLKQPPQSALKTIKAGRLKGMTDISPQWRIKAMTETFGPIGQGWKYEITNKWNEPGADGVVFAFAEVDLFYKSDGEWSDAIPGIGGSMLVAKEKNGLHSSDEGYKMAITDALSVAMKFLGVASSIYEGKWDGSKYNDPDAPVEYITQDMVTEIEDLIVETKSDKDKFLRWLKVDSTDKILLSWYQDIINKFKDKKEMS